MLPAKRSLRKTVLKARLVPRYLASREIRGFRGADSLRFAVADRPAYLDADQHGVRVHIERDLPKTAYRILPE